MEQKKKFGRAKNEKKIGKISEKNVFDFFSILLLSVDSNNFFSKNGLNHFLGEPSGYLHAKFQKILTSGYREKLVTDGLTNELTDKG